MMYVVLAGAASANEHPPIEAKKKSSMRLRTGSDLLAAIFHLARKLESSTSGIPSYFTVLAHSLTPCPRFLLC
jgi:hypothetical protein